MITVVISTYNGIDYIREQLRSILDQTLVPDRIIIRDDGSSDGTPGLINNFCRNVKGAGVIDFSANPANMGFAKSFMNAMRLAMREQEGFEESGISESSGTSRSSGNSESSDTSRSSDNSESSGIPDIVFFCDQDDHWYPEKVERMAAVFREHPEVLALSCGYVLTDGEGVPFDEKTRFNRGGSSTGSALSGNIQKISLQDFIRYPHYPGMSMAFRAELIPEVLEGYFDTEAAHDWAVNFTAAEKDGLYYLDEVLGTYRQHAANTLGTIRQQNRIARRRFRIKMLTGIIKDMEGSLKALKNRGNALRSDALKDPGIERGAAAVGTDHKTEAIEAYLKEKIAFDERRVGLIQEGHMVGVMIHDLSHRDMITLRQLLGDMYSAV